MILVVLSFQIVLVMIDVFNSRKGSLLGHGPTDRSMLDSDPDILYLVIALRRAQIHNRGDRDSG